MLQPGAEIDVWVVEKSLGSGGMGSVYRCHNKHASRILAAIKTLEPAARSVPEAEQRFVREAEILFALDHANVVKVRNIRLDLATPYLEMEFVEGESLESRLCRGPVPPAEALRLARQLFDAVAYLHARGIRHRDIKPANLVITKEGVLKLVDFGLASEGDSDRITRANTTFGTVSYAPPEWVQPDTLDPELWDVYACGVVTWEMLTARVAFPGSPLVDPRQVAIQIMTVKQNHPPLDPGEGFTEPVRELCKDMTQADPDLRVHSMQEAFDRITRIDGVASAANVPISADLQGTARRKSTEAPQKSTGSHKAAAAPAARKKTTKTAKVEPPPRRSSGGIIVALGGVVASVVFLGILVVGLGAVWLIVGASAIDQPANRADKRDVDVVVEGLPRGTDVALRVGDAKASAVDGFVHRYVAVPVGAANIRWAIGAGCTVDGCPGAACPVWCDTGEAAHTIVAGSGAQSVSVPITPSAPRDVALKLPFATDKIAVAASTADGHVAELKDGVWRVPGLLPGRYELTVNAGTCTPEVAGCAATSACPAGCSSVRMELVVKPGAGPLEQVVTIAAPEVKVAEPDKPDTKIERPDKPDVPPPPSKGGKAGRPILQSEFAKWLAKNPEWQRDSAIAAGKADDNYLREWSSGAAPAPANTVVSVSWLAAQAYCGSRGGLASVDAEPLQWDEGATAPFQEWRQKDGKPAWRRSDGVDSTAAKRTESNAFTGFRCAK